MKKIVVFPILLMLMLVPAFAQDEENGYSGSSSSDSKSGWTFSGGTQVRADLFYAAHASGSIEETGKDKQEWGKNIDGSINLLSSSEGRAPTMLSYLEIGNSGEGDNYSYDLYVSLLLGAGDGRDGPLFTMKGSKFFETVIEGFSVDEWYAKGTAGMFEGYFGNTGFGGVVDSYTNFTDWSNYNDDGLKGFYVITPGAGRVGTNDAGLFVGGDPTDLMFNGGNAVLGFGVNFLDGLRFAAGTDLTDFYAVDEPYASASGVNAAFFFSGQGLFNILTFDVFYGIAGVDYNTAFYPNLRDRATPPGAADPAAMYINRFGVYAGLGFIDWLGLSVGYSGVLPGTEKRADTEDGKTFKEYSVKYPLYSAIHINANAALGKFDITLNNNLSFSGVKGAVERKPGEDSIRDFEMKEFMGEGYDKMSTNFFAWDAGLAVKFQAADALNLCLQLVNQLSTTSSKNDNSPAYTGSGTTNTFFVGVNAEYNVGPVTFGAGLSLTADSESAKANTTGYEYKGSKSSTYFGIPLFFKVAF